MFPIQITAKDLPVSPALDETIRKKADKLNHFYDRINSCRVVIEIPQKHKHQGKLFNVRIDLNVPGKVLVVNRKLDEDIYIAVRDAFSAMERQLEEHSRKRHGRVKAHNGLLHGHVVRLVQKEGYGFIAGTDGNEYYFSVTNVSYPRFEQLIIGDAVEYHGELQGEGWAAQHVVKERHNHEEVV